MSRYLTPFLGKAFLGVTWNRLLASPEKANGASAAQHTLQPSRRATDALKVAFRALSRCPQVPFAPYRAAGTHCLSKWQIPPQPIEFSSSKVAFERSLVFPTAFGGNLIVSCMWSDSGFCCNIDWATRTVNMG